MCGVAVLAILCTTHLASAGGVGTDADRRARVEKMYAGYAESFPSVIDVAPRLAADLLQKAKVLFVDVREPEEQRVSMLPGAVTEQAFLARPEAYKDRIVIAYCTIGYRSGRFAERLAKQGGGPVYNLRGGLLAWVHEGGKVYAGDKQTKRIHVHGRKWNLAPEGHEAVW